MQALPFSLQPKDIIGPAISFAAMLISFGAAGVSVYYYRKNYALSKQNADRSLFMDGQKFLIEICKQLTAEPLLWCLYDGDVVQLNLREKFAKELDDLKFRRSWSRLRICT